MMRKSFLEKMNFYNTDYKKCQDYELWLRGMHEHEYANIDEKLIKYRVSRYNHLNDICKIKIIKQCRNLNILKKIIFNFQNDNIHNLKSYLMNIKIGVIGLVMLGCRLQSRL